MDSKTPDAFDVLTCLGDQIPRGIYQTDFELTLIWYMT